MTPSLSAATPQAGDRRVKVRRVAAALGASAVMVVVIAALVPRIYLANDDIALTELLRANVFTPWISPLLAQPLGFAYQRAPGVPWYGLYQYLVIIATGAVLIHICIELVDRRPGFGKIATWIGAILIGASHAVLASRITWTAVSISAIGTAVAAFVAHAQLCQAAGTRVSRLRALVYGLLLVAGFALRPDGIAASGVALLPMGGWAALRFARTRHLPRPAALLWLVAPIALVVAIQYRIPQARGGETKDYFEFNLQRGQISDRSAFTQLDQRAPQVLARAGWTADEYRDFMRWRLIDERDYPLAKMQRLLDTGGAPVRFTLAWSKVELRGIFDGSGPSAWLLVTLVITGILLAWLRTIPRWRGLGFTLGSVVFLVVVPLWMTANYRFPPRVSLSFYTVAALGLFVFLARQVADRPAEPELRPGRDLRASVALVVISLFTLSWARALTTWLGQDPWPNHDELQALEDRIAARKGFVFVYIQTGLVDFDPLRAEPRSYEGVQGGWATFSAAWYDSIARVGAHRGADVLGAMVDNPGAYFLGGWEGRAEYEDWIQRKLGNRDVRLALVDVVATFKKDRATLYRLVTHAMVPGDDEWRALQREEWRMNDALPGPPSVADLKFRAIAFAAPYEQHLARLRHPTTGTVAPIDGGVRCMVDSAPRSACTVTGDDQQHVGVHVPVNGLRAARFEVTLINPENILSLNAYAQTPTSRLDRWRWVLDAEAHKFGFTGTFTLVPGYSARRLELHVTTARPRDIRDLDIFVTVKPGTRAGFELRHLDVAEPERD